MPWSQPLVHGLARCLRDRLLRLCPVGPQPGCYHDQAARPRPQPLPSRGFLKLNVTGWEGPLHWGAGREDLGHLKGEERGPPWWSSG